MKGQRK